MHEHLVALIFVSIMASRHELTTSLAEGSINSPAQLVGEPMLCHAASTAQQALFPKLISLHALSEQNMLSAMPQVKSASTVPQVDQLAYNQ